MKSGIYYIRNQINQKFYVASSQNVFRRKSYHLRLLKRNKHPNIYLQNAWNKYGETSFIFEWRPTPINKLLKEEQQELDTHSNLYNIAIIVGASFRNRKHKNKSKMLIRTANEGKNHWNFGKVTPKNVRMKISKSNTISMAKSRKLSDNAIRYIRKYYNPTINGGVGTRTLAKKFGVCRKTIILVLRNKRYKHL